MNNRDFARLAKTPRPDRFGSGNRNAVAASDTGRSVRSEEDETTRKEIKAAKDAEKRAKAKAWKKREVARRQSKQSEGQTNYRDRAKERAMGGDLDFEATKELAAKLGGQVLHLHLLGRALNSPCTMPQPTWFARVDIVLSAVTIGLSFAGH